MLALTCLTWVILSFEWPTILEALKRFNISRFVVGTLLVLPVSLALRSIRWLGLADAPVTPRTFIHAFLTNGIATGLAVVTPMQAGELIKARMLPPERRDTGVTGLAAVAVEKFLDTTCLCSLAICAILLHLDMRTPAAGAFALTTLTAALALGRFTSLLARLAPSRLQPWIAGLRSIPERTLVSSSVVTPVLWICHGILWWLAASSIGIDLDLTQLVTLLASVMLAVVATMAPGGLGVSELTAASSLQWAGLEADAAQSAALAIRLITPALAIAGLGCAFAFHCWIKAPRPAA